MFRPILFAAASLAVFLPGVKAGGPGQPSKQITAPDGPNKLTECTPCDKIVSKWIECQKLKGPNAKTRECICLPNGNPDGWYGWMDQCRTCLGSGNEAGMNSFFDIMARTVTQLFVSCTNAGGGVVSDGTSICASNAMFRLCTALKDKSSKDPSWASDEDFRDNSKHNATFVLNISVPEPPSNSAGVSSTGSVSPTASGTGGSPGGSATSTPPANSGSNSTNNRASGAGLSATPVWAGQVVGLVLAVGFGALLV